jgi:hypothetical protein
MKIGTAFYNRQRIASVIRQLEDNTDDFPSMAEVDEFYYTANNRYEGYS